jgi:hypothetical protein
MILSDVELMTAGEIRLGNNVEIGSGFTGIRMAFPPMDEYPASVSGWHFVGINNDQMMVGISADDGKFYAAGGAMIVDQNAITLSGILYSMQHTASWSGLVRTTKIGMVTSATSPIGAIEFHSPGVTTNLATNGDFETAALAGWTKTTETGGGWTSNATIKHGGSNSAKWDPTADTNFGTLTSTARIAVTALKGYKISAWAYFETSLSQLDGRQITINFYNASSGGTNLASELLQWESLSADTWLYKEIATIAPLGATYADIVVVFSHNGSTGGQGNCYVDDISFQEVDVDRAIRFNPDPTVYNGRIQWPVYESVRSADSGNLALGSWHNRPIMMDDIGTFIYFGGKVADRVRVQNTASKTAIYSSLIRANQLGRRGTVTLYLMFNAFNSTGSGKTVTIDVDFGGVNLYSGTLPSFTSTANDHWGLLHLVVANNNVQEAQYCVFMVEASQSGAYGAVQSQDFQRFSAFLGSVDTKVDNTLTVSVTLNAASASLGWTSWGWARGPYEAG